VRCAKACDARIAAAMNLDVILIGVSTPAPKWRKDMDGSAFRNLPVGRIMIFAAIGALTTAAASIGAVLWLVWFIAGHVSFH